MDDGARDRLLAYAADMQVQEWLAVMMGDFHTAAYSAAERCAALAQAGRPDQLTRALLHAARTQDARRN